MPPFLAKPEECPATTAWKFAAQTAYMMAEQQKAENPGSDWQAFGKNLTTSELALLCQLIAKGNGEKVEISYPNSPPAPKKVIKKKNFFMMAPAIC